MEKELLQRVALAQRDHWNEIAKKDGDYLGSQATPAEMLDGPDFGSFNARDWASFWNQYVEHSKSW